MVPEIDILHKEIAKKMSENPPFVGIFACILPAWRFERAICNTNVPRSLVGARQFARGAQRLRAWTAKLDDANASAFELGRIVALDTCLAAQVLRIANRAYFKHQQRMTQIEAAAARFDARMLRSLVLTADRYGRFSVPPYFAERLEQMQSHASIVARIALNGIW